MVEIKGIIYIATNNINGMQYVGLTTRSLNYRINGHLNNAIKGKGSKKTFQEAIRNFGMENITFDVIDTAENSKDLCKKEIKHIEKFNTLYPEGYNQNRGGSFHLNNEPYIVDGEVYSSLASLAEAYDILEITMQKRMKTGHWSLEQACGIEPPPQIEISGIEIELEGVKFSSYQKACEHYALDKRIVHMRINRLGWSIEEAFELEERINPHKLIIDGKEFVNFKAACEHFNLHVKKTESRIRLGWSFKQAFDLEERPVELIKCGTETFKTYKEVAKRYKMEIGLLQSRIYNKWTVEQAVGLENPPIAKTSNGPIPVVVNGKEFQSKEEVYRFYGIEGSSVRGHIRNGKSLEQAISILTRPKKQIIVEKNTYSSLTEAANAYGLNSSTVAYRIKVGWTIDEAFGLAPAPDNNPYHKTIEVDGKKFPSTAAAADYYGVNVSTARFRISQEWSMRECFELDPPPTQAVKKFLVTDPKGKEYFVDDFASFARDQGMPREGQGLRKVIYAEKLHSWKGWKIKRIDETDNAKI